MMTMMVVVEVVVVVGFVVMVMIMIMMMIFDPIGSLFMPPHDLIDPLLLHKNRFVSITFSSRDTWT